MGQEEGKSNGAGMLSRGRACTGPFVLRVFIFLLQAGILGEGFSRIFVSFSGAVFPGHDLH